MPQSNSCHLDLEQVLYHILDILVRRTDEIRGSECFPFSAASSLQREEELTEIPELQYSCSGPCARFVDAYLLGNMKSGMAKECAGF